VRENDSFIEEDGSLSPKVLHARIDCVTPPSKEQLEELRRFIQKKYAAENVEFSVKFEPSIVGGFRLFVGEDTYDWSTKGRLYRLSEHLSGLRREYDPEKMISLLKEDISNYREAFARQQVGTTVTVGDGIAVISGLHDVQYGEIVLFESGIKGMVQDIRVDGTTGIVLFGQDSEVLQGTKVTRTGKTAGIPVTSRMLGRMIDPLGKIIDGGEDVPSKHYYPIERPAPGITERKSVSRPLETGLLTIDSMFPIGRGQRELIIGDRQTGKTSIAVDTILNQKGKNVVCVYVSVGQKASSVAKVVSTLQKHDALSYTVIVSSSASDPASMQYIAPYAGCAVAEYFMDRGRDTLIIYDDLSKHAVAYRTLSLLLERAPGREAYPGDVFYLHSRLLERAAQLSDALGGGSMTALPIVETQAGDVSAYIPTNIISITDGQIFLESELFFAGQRPAVNVGLSVSRVGGSAQTKVMKKSVGSLRLDLAQYREMQVFSRFGGDLDDATVKELKYGQGLMQLLIQPVHSPLSQWQQVVTLVCAQNRFFLDVPAKEVKMVQNDLLKYFAEKKSVLCGRIDHEDLTLDMVKDEILEAAELFAKEKLN